MEALDGALPNVRLHHVLSQPGPGWQGWQGHVRREVLEQELDDLDSWHYFLCGPPGMVRAMREMLGELDVPRLQVTLENFDGYE